MHTTVVHLQFVFCECTNCIPTVILQLITESNINKILSYTVLLLAILPWAENLPTHWETKLFKIQIIWRLVCMNNVELSLQRQVGNLICFRMQYCTFKWGRNFDKLIFCPKKVPLSVECNDRDDYMISIFVEYLIKCETVNKKPLLKVDILCNFSCQFFYIIKYH